MVSSFLRRMFFRQRDYQDCCQPDQDSSRPVDQSLAASQACDRVRDQVCFLEKCLIRCRCLRPRSDGRKCRCGRGERPDQAIRQPLTRHPGQIVVDEYRLRSRAISFRKSGPELVSMSLQVKLLHMNLSRTNRKHSQNRKDYRRNRRDHSRPSDNNSCRRSHN